MSSGILLKVQSLASVRWKDLSMLLSLTLSSLASSAVASQLIGSRRGRNGSLRNNALIVGANCDEDLSDRIERQTLARPVGYLFSDTSGQLVFRNEAGEECHSTLDKVLDSQVIDDVLVVDSCKGLNLDDILYASSIRGKTFRTLMRTPLAPAGRYRTQALGPGEFLLSHESVPVDRFTLAIKRLIDISGAIVGLIFCAIAYVIFSSRIRKETEGSVIFRQTRVGCNGRLFTLYKFRSMHVSAEDRQHELREHNEMTGNMFKMRDDPRITPLGRLLRKTYIDELPQFWNVLRGEMSIVGTRPPTPAEVECYEPHHQRRLSMKPGVTGLWQLDGNKKVNDFEAIVGLDCRYIDTWSIWQDCKIIFHTVLRVFAGHGY
jgi:lipopolysaccharide/colanic/teichoic acid biosynthesis glycosyltransferase